VQAKECFDIAIESGMGYFSGASGKMFGSFPVKILTEAEGVIESPY